MEASNNLNDEDDFDDTPIDMNSTVEVNVPDYNPTEDMMDDDDEAGNNNINEEPSKTSMEGGADASLSASPPIIDQSKATFTSHTDAIYAIASHYDPSSHSLSIASGGGDDKAYLHQITTSNGVQQTNTTALSHPHTDSISCVAFNTPFVTKDVSGKVQNNQLAVGSYDGSIVLYNAENNSGELLQVLEGPSDVEFLTFHPKGGTVLLAGSIADGTIWMYHTPSKSCLQVFVGHEGGVTAGAFTPDGKWVVSVGQDGTCRVWAPKTGMSRHVFRLMDGGGHGGGDGSVGAGLTCLAVGGGQDGQLAICGGEDGNAYVVHISGKKMLAKLSHFEEAPKTTTTNNNNNDGMDDDNTEEARSIEAVGFCPPTTTGTAHWCATGGVDGILKVWNMNVATGTSTAQLRQRCVREDAPQAAGITRLVWHATQPLVICSYTDGVVCVWDVRVGTMVGSLTGHEDMINGMSVSFVEGSDVAVVVTGSDDKMVKMFEFCP
eukprot:CAMPEP_0172302202 /NCGR_PEP_ID=MMETSP1058-20130122/3944_1 /TAXON_ID=83371 /ORGANISM="Detonula confervacea, Strain CCMP 353" /LENGTH=490 /DNA_ID=CAMNT_0013012593 /DNA_START=158 /DNA_END=1630 /DNA_ORIENTATION=+